MGSNPAKLCRSLAISAGCLSMRAKTTIKQKALPFQKSSHTVFVLASQILRITTVYMENIFTVYYQEVKLGIVKP